MLSGKEAIGEVLLYLAPLFPLSSTIRYCRNVARGIVSAVREKKADLLIMGWHGHTRTRRFVFGSTVDPVMERVPCDVIILKNCGDQKFKNVLVPVAGGPNSAFALEVASIVADDDDGEITLFTVGPDLDLDALREENRERINLPYERVKTKVVEEGHVVTAILREANRKEDPYDLVVIGATSAPALRQFMSASVPENVARAYGKPLIMVKASRGLRSWIRRWV
jgi:APA family basic amino acid/polyamine antiporter